MSFGRYTARAAATSPATGATSALSSSSAGRSVWARWPRERWPAGAATHRSPRAGSAGRDRPHQLSVLPPSGPSPRLAVAGHADAPGACGGAGGARPSLRVCRLGRRQLGPLGRLGGAVCSASATTISRSTTGSRSSRTSKGRPTTIRRHGSRCKRAATRNGRAREPGGQRCLGGQHCPAVSAARGQRCPVTQRAGCRRELTVQATDAGGAPIGCPP